MSSMIANMPVRPDFAEDSFPPSVVSSLAQAEAGRLKIEWAFANMPVLRGIASEFARTRPLAGLRLAISIHVEAKTACLAKTLQAAGAEVALTACNSLSTQDDVAAALAEDGLHVYCVHGVDETSYQDHLKMALACRPHIVIDDGGDLTALLHGECRVLAGDLIGISEETTTGVHRVRGMAAEGRLRFPVVAVNDARSKHLFDNRYGTGQSVWTAIMATTNLLVAGKTAVVAGYGMCGRGVALRARGLGARVIVTEIDPIKACEALMEGFDVRDMDDAAAEGDVFVTVTGCKDVIGADHFRRMKDGVILCNAGHFDVEINLPELAAQASSSSIVRPNIEGYVMPDGRRLNVLAAGRLVNLASGDGHPAEIMDMSFSLQARTAAYIAGLEQPLPVAVHEVPQAIDDAVALRLLDCHGKKLVELTPEQAEYLGFGKSSGGADGS